MKVFLININRLRIMPCSMLSNEIDQTAPFFVWPKSARGIRDLEKSSEKIFSPANVNKLDLSSTPPTYEIVMNSSLFRWFCFFHNLLFNLIQSEMLKVAHICITWLPLQVLALYLCTQKITLFHGNANWIRKF